MSNFERVAYHIKGRIAMLPAEAALVEKYAALCSTWLEIGTLWGGSAILAALANPGLRVTCIDPMVGYYGGKDKSVDELPTMDDFYTNLQRFEVAGQVHLIQAYSKPDPLPEDFRCDGILVDGAHDYETVCHDLREIAVRHATRFLLAHDTNDRPVARAVRDSLPKAWKLIERSECMKVFQYE